jgi:cbb3-type cytochrome oxidase maturation protein
MPRPIARVESLYILVPLSVALVLAIGVLFWRALRSGQFDDLERPAHDLLMDDDTPTERERGK